MRHGEDYTLTQRILCLDVGDKRIGIAISDPLGIIAQPLQTYVRIGYGPDVRHIVALAAQYEFQHIVCGLPRNMDGSLGGQAEKVHEFAVELEKAGFQVYYWDERMTTRTAERALIQADMRRAQRKQKVDMVAAVIILQAFLDAGGLRTLSNTHPKIHEEDNKVENLQDRIVELIDEDGQPVQFYHLMTLEHEGHDYVLLTEAPEQENDDEEGDVYILRIDQDDQGEDCYVTVEDEDTLQAVFDQFVALSEQDDDEDEPQEQGEEE